MADIKERPVDARDRSTSPPPRKRGLLATSLSWLFTSVKGTILAAVTLAMLFAFLTHSVGWAFDLANMMLRKGLGVASISAQATHEARNLRSRLAHADVELEKQRDELSDLRKRLSVSEDRVAIQGQRIRQFETELSTQRAVATELREERDRLTRAASTQRQRIQQFEKDLLAQQAVSTDLREDRDRLQNARHVRFKGKQVPVREAAQQTVTSIRDRTTKTATANVAAAFGEGIPFFGIGIIVAATSYETTMACMDMEDLYALQVALDPNSTIPEDRDRVCGLQVPTTKEIWQQARESPGRAWEWSTDALDGAGAKLNDLPKPDFSGAWGATIGMWDYASSWFGSWFD